jgi:hypothetical protein
MKGLRSSGRCAFGRGSLRCVDGKILKSIRSKEAVLKHFEVSADRVNLAVSDLG